MKRKFSVILLAVLLLCAQMTVPASAAKLPDKWEAPSGLVLTDATIAKEEFQLKLTYNKGADLSKYLSLKIADQLSQYGYSCRDAALQVDWTVDSTAAGWKYHENWNVLNHGGGHASTNWEYYNLDLRPQTTDYVTILRLLNESDWRWNDPVKGIGQFLAGKTYTKKIGGGKTAHLIDLTKHTVYVRARFVTMVEDAQHKRSYVLSDWSDIAAIGKDAGSLSKRPDSLETPVLSNLVITDEIANGAPVAAFNLSNPQQVKDASAYAIANGERCIVRCEVSVNNGPWTEIILANSDIKDGVYKAPLHQAASQADANTHLRLRAYYSYRSHLGAELFRSAYSNIVEFGAPGWGKASSWAQSDIEKAGGLGLIPVSLKGVDLTRPITREEFTELTLILYEKTTGVKTTPYSPNPFKDTNNPEILKAYNVGIAKGMSATTYAPKALITREQVATILLRALKLIAPNGDYSTTGAPTFLDQKDISDWALSSVQVISKLGIIKGANGKFMPRAVTTAQQAAGYGNTTREQAILLSLRTYETVPSLKAAAPATSSLPSGSNTSSQIPGRGQASFSGNWSVKDPATGAEICTMTLSQSGSTVTGTFTDINKNSGKMSGTVSDNVLTAAIDNEFFEGWKFVLTMDTGNNSFTGVWASSTESHPVTGSRV